MRILEFMNGLGIGGTEKAACRWAVGLVDKGHSVQCITLEDGPRRKEFDRKNIPVHCLPAIPDAIRETIKEIKPDVIHTHAPGTPHPGDVLGEALKALPRIPVVQTNVFGLLNNPAEDSWVDFRLFISWMSCVQAARRAGVDMDEEFFRWNSVAVYPVDAVEPAKQEDVRQFRRQLGLEDGSILFGRLGRPDPVKWTNLTVRAFRKAMKKHDNIFLLLREPPPEVAAVLSAAHDAKRFLILPTTDNDEELKLTLSSLDAIFHLSSIGESFGYGIAEAMNLGKPVITNPAPWCDQAQIELVRHNQDGFVAGTASGLADAITTLAESGSLRESMGQSAMSWIRSMADPQQSLARVESVLKSTADGQTNPHIREDIAKAQPVMHNLDRNGFGHSTWERAALHCQNIHVRVSSFARRR